MKTEVGKVASNEELEMIRNALEAVINASGAKVAGVVLHVWFRSDDKDLDDMGRSIYLMTALGVPKGNTLGEDISVILAETPGQCQEWAIRMGEELERRSAKAEKAKLPTA